MKYEECKIQNIQNHHAEKLRKVQQSLLSVVLFFLQWIKNICLFDNIRMAQKYVLKKVNMQVKNDNI